MTNKTTNKTPKVTDPLMTAEGTWNLIVSTPLGKQRSEVTLMRDPSDQDSPDNPHGAGGSWTGTARDLASGEQVPLTEITMQGNEITWHQSITKPMRLNLVVTLTITGDQAAGTAKAGRLPSSRVSGARVVESGVTR
ncbi:MAG TPA: hypothetical protein VGX23_06005 [Actinocrinis sp.]|nr:hypothetical protein [Actinocrinis sp.]